MRAMRILGAALLFTTLGAGLHATCQAQSFPLKSGHWEATTVTDGGNDVTAFCINDDNWKRGLNNNKACTISQMSSGLTGSSYHLDCNIGKSGKMSGDVKLSYDGREHMVGSGSFSGSVNGKPMPASQSKTDYRWKSSTCDGNELNLRAEKREKEQQQQH